MLTDRQDRLQTAIIAYRELTADTDLDALDEAHARILEIPALESAVSEPDLHGFPRFFDIVCGEGKQRASDLSAWAGALRGRILPGSPVLRPPGRQGSACVAVALFGDVSAETNENLYTRGWRTIEMADSCRGERAEGEEWDVRLLLAGAPTDVAVSDAAGPVTYSQLWELVLQVCSHIGPPIESPRCVLLVGSRDRWTIAAILACWLAGAAWCAVDAHAPPGRRSALENEICPDLVLDCSAVARGTRGPAELPWKYLTMSPESIAYLVSSSGSTGRAKVSALPAGGLVPLIAAWKDSYRFDNPQRICSLAGLDGDVLLGDLLKALASGGSLHIVPDEARVDPAAVAQVLAEYECTVLESTPVMVRAVFRRLNAEGGHWPRLTIVGSDTLRVVEARELVSLSAGRSRVINGYGTTETTIETMTYECAEMPETLDGLCPIGRPLLGAKVSVVDSHGREVPIGEVGRLCLDTPGLLIGQIVSGSLKLRDPGPFDTGDLASMDCEGVFRFHGRRDSVVKVRGYRVELGEVENALLSAPGVQEVFVTTFRRAGVSELAAFVAGDDVSLPEIRTYLAERFAAATVPAEIYCRRKLPRLAGGKLDRVTMIEEVESVTTGCETAELKSGNTVEDCVTRSWTRVLGHVPDRDATFFDSGGTSVLVLALVEDLETELDGMSITPADIFRYPTVASFAASLSTVTQKGQGASGRQARSRKLILQDVAAGRMAISEAHKRLRGRLE